MAIWQDYKCCKNPNTSLLSKGGSRLTARLRLRKIARERNAQSYSIQRKHTQEKEENKQDPEEYGATQLMTQSGSVWSGR